MKEKKIDDPRKIKCSLDVSKDSAVAASESATIKTLDDLISYSKIDLSVWEVERHVINKWEVVMREPATTVYNDDGTPFIAMNEKGGMSTLWTRKSRVPMHEMLYQVKVWLRRKTPLQTATESLLSKIERNAPLLPRLPKIPSRKGGRRSLEICIMDPHIGLLCRQPEADAAWDIDLAASYIMRSIDDLFDRSKAYGPFDEVFMPFGNDFCHVDNLAHTTTKGTPQPEAIAWHHMYEAAEGIAIKLVEKARTIGKTTKIYEIPGNHSVTSDFTLARILKAYFRRENDVTVDASSATYKFHRCGVNLIGYEHGHSVKPLRLAGLMANERRRDWAETEYREWHLGDQHRKGSADFEEQGVSIEYVPGITAPNEWHKTKGFSHQKRGAMAFVWDWDAGQIARVSFNVSQYTHKPL